MSDSPSPVELTQDAVAELQRLLRDLDGRIDRQKKRIEKSQINGPAAFKHDAQDGPPPLPAETSELRAALAGLLENRRLLADEIAKLEAELP